MERGEFLVGGLQRVGRPRDAQRPPRDMRQFRQPAVAFGLLAAVGIHMLAEGFGSHGDRRRTDPTRGRTLLALAVLIKGFPIFAAPVFALYELEMTGERGIREAIRMAWRPIARGVAWLAGVIGAATLVVGPEADAGRDVSFIALLNSGSP